MGYMISLYFLESWVGSLMPLSALFAGMSGGALIDAAGRKGVILATGPAFVGAYILIGSAVNVWMIYIGRVISGASVGLLSLVVPVYLSETIQPEIRGALGFLPTTIGNSGILVAFVLGMYVDWSALAYLGVVVPFIFSILMFFVPETPRWLLTKGRDTEAVKSLKWLRGGGDVRRELRRMRKMINSTRHSRSSLSLILKWKYARSLLVSAGLMIFQQFSGINAVIFYTVSIFESAGSSIDEHICTVIVGVVNMGSTLVATALIDKAGRRVLLLISAAFMAIALALLGTYFYAKQVHSLAEETVEWAQMVHDQSWLPLASFMLYVIAFSLGWGPIPWLFMGEALPSGIREAAGATVTALNWSCTFIVTKTFPILTEELGAAGVFFVFAGVMAVSLIYTVLCVPETRGKSLEEIESMWTGRQLSFSRASFSRASTRSTSSRGNVV